MLEDRMIGFLTNVCMSFHPCYGAARSGRHVPGAIYANTWILAHG